MSGITETQKSVLALVSSALFGAPVSIPKAADFKDIFREAKQQAVLPLVFSAARPYIPTEELPHWSRIVGRFTAHSMRAEWEHIRLHALMAANKIPYVVLKGSASAAYYPEPLLRTMGDVDFLVPREALDKACKVFKENGFKPKGSNESPHHIAYQRSAGSSALIWELHWDIVGLPRGAAEDALREHMLSVFDMARKRETTNGAYMVPSAFHHGLVLLTHTASHMLNTGIGLRHLCDWAVFVNSFTDEEFLDIFEGKLRAVGLWTFAKILTAAAVKYLHLGERQWAKGTDEALLLALTEDIFAGGNFGTKDAERAYEAVLITDKRGMKVSSAGFFRRLCSFLNVPARKAVPAARRYPILLPVGWIYVGARRIFRVLSGKRTMIHPGKILRGTTKRKKLYKEFCLYETE